MRFEHDAHQDSFKMFERTDLLSDCADSNLDPFCGAGIKSDMSRESGVFAVPVKPGSTENWNPRRCGILVVRRAPRFWMPDSLCRFRMFTASRGRSVLARLLHV